MAAATLLLDPERLMDLHRRERPLGRSDDHLLFAVRSVADDIYARNVGRFVVLRHHRPGRCELTAEVSGDVGSLLLRCGEEEGRALERRADSELDALESAAATHQPADRLLSDADAMTVAPRPFKASERLAVRDQRDVFGPRAKNESRLDTIVTTTVDRERLVRVLVRIAERTVMHGHAVQRVDAWYLWELVHYAGRENKSPALKRPTVCAANDEGTTRALGHGDGPRSNVNRLVSRQLGAAKIEQLGRRRAVPSEKSMCGLGRAISRSAVIDDHDPSTTATQHERRGKSRRTSADDHDVVLVDGRWRQSARAKRYAACDATAPSQSLTIGFDGSITKYSSGACAPLPWPRPKCPAASRSGSPVKA